jgi:hypothetical protein
LLLYCITVIRVPNPVILLRALCNPTHRGLKEGESFCAIGLLQGLHPSQSTSPSITAHTNTPGSTQSDGLEPHCVCFPFGLETVEAKEPDPRWMDVNMGHRGPRDLPADI